MVCVWVEPHLGKPTLHAWGGMLYMCTVLELVPRELFVGVVQNGPAVPRIRGTGAVSKGDVSYPTAEVVLSPGHGVRRLPAVAFVAIQRVLGITLWYSLHACEGHWASEHANIDHLPLAPFRHFQPAWVKYYPYMYIFYSRWCMHIAGNVFLHLHHYDARP